MATPILNMFSDTTKGILLIVIGTVLLLNTLGIIEKGLDGVVIVLAIGLVVIGLLKVRIDKIITQKMNEYRSKR